VAASFAFFPPRAAQAQTFNTTNVINVGNGDVAGLIAAINSINQSGGGTIVLAAHGQYTVSQANNWWYGPNAFPAITSNILIIGQGATISRNPFASAFRFFYIGGGIAAGQSAGTLTLTDLTLTGGLAQGGAGGSGGGGGGGGAGMGGAIYNQGTLTLVRVIATNNTASGGSGGIGSFSGLGGGGGGGLSGNGGDNFVQNGNTLIFGSAGGGGGGFRGDGGGGGFHGGTGGGFLGSEGGASNCIAGTGALGGIGGAANGNGSGGAGGGGFETGENGHANSGANGGPGSQGGGAGGSGSSSTFCGGGGGAFGGGGGGASASNPGAGGGGGGVGGGGAGGSGVGGGSGGFGGGGGSDFESGGNGGFGAGGGAGANTPGSGGLGAGNGSTSGGGGGGAGMGGVIFNQVGHLRLGSDSLSGNAAVGGAGSSGGGNADGLGGGFFNLDGQAEIFNTPVSTQHFGSATAGQDFYNFSDGAELPAAGQAASASVAGDNVNPTSYAQTTTLFNGSSTTSTAFTSIVSLLDLGSGFNGVADQLNAGNAALNCTTCTTSFVVAEDNFIAHGTPLVINSMQWIGSPAFSVASTHVLAQSGSTLVNVQFTPTAEGPASAILVINDNAPDSPHLVYVSGTGGFPAASFNPNGDTLSAQLNQTSTGQVTITNSSSTDSLSIQAVSLSSTSGFLSQTNNCTTAVIAPGGRCTVTLKFTPSSFPGDSGTLQLTDNEQNGGSSIAITGQTQNANQTITVTQAAPASAVYGTSFTVGAIASSNLPVAIAATGACSGGGTASAQISMTSGTGTCTVQYTQAGNTQFNAAPSVTDSVIAVKAQATVTLSSLTTTYNAAQQMPTAVTSPLGLAVTWSANATEINAGTYPLVTASVADTNYQGSASGTFIILKATPTVSVSGYTLTFDGTAHAATGSASGVGGGTLAGLNLSATSHTNAGVYSDAWSFSDPNGNYSGASGTITDTITRAAATVTVAPYNLTFDGTPHTATGSVTGVNSTVLGGLDLSATTHTNAGAYTDTWTFTDTTGNYTNSSGTVNDALSKATPTVTVTPYTVTFDGAAHTATGGATGVNHSALGGLDLSGTTHTSAGAYTDAWTFTDTTGNYINTSGSVNDVVSKANAVVSVTPYSVTFDGTAHTATGGVTGVNNAPLAGLDLSGTTHTSAGVYTDTWTFTDATGNYVNSSGSVNDVVSKANAVVSVTPYSVTFDGTAHTATGGVTGVNNAPLAGLDLSGTTHTNAGVYTDTWTFTDTTGNYAAATGTISDTIARAAARVTWTPNSATMTYGSNLQGVLNASGSDGAAIVYTIGASTVTAATVVPAGNFTIVASLSGDDNHQPASATFALTVKPAPLTITASSQTMYFGATPQPIAASYSGFVNGDSPANLAPSASCSTGVTAATSVGMFASACGGAADPNYAISYVPGVVTILPAPQSILAPPIANQLFTGSALTLSLHAVSSAGLPVSYTVSGPAIVSCDQNNACSLTIASPGTITIVASAGGTAFPNYQPASATQSFSVNLGLGWGLFATGHGCGVLRLDGHATVDSYDSALGAYPLGRDRSSGNIGANGNVRLDGDATVYGVLNDPNGNTTGDCDQGDGDHDRDDHGTSTVTSLEASGHSAITGGIVALAGALDFPAPAAATASTNDQDIHGGHGRRLALAPGNYGDMETDGGVIVDLSAGSYTFNTLRLRGDSRLHVASGPVVITIAGGGDKGTKQVMELSRGAVENQGAPSQLVVLYPGTGAINLASGDQTALVLYAPNADVTIDGSDSVSGAIIAATIRAQGGARIHFDRALTQLPLPH